MKATFNAAGEVLVVTGGARGIGLAASLAYAQAGGTVIVLDVAPSAELVDVPGLTQRRVDVSDRDDVVTAVNAVVAEHGRVDGLIAGAAVQPRSLVVDTEVAEWRRTLAINLDGVVWATQAVLPVMRTQHSGSIVMFSSGLAHMGRAQAAAYSASKGAILPFARSLAAEVAPDGIRVNVLWPGVIDTAQFAAANQGDERSYWAGSTGIGQPEDVVGPLMFLLSDAASMTGSTLTRDRSFTARQP